jgi:hypothetical protein
MSLSANAAASIVERVKQGVGNLAHVQEWPDDGGAQSKRGLAHSRAEIWVGYLGSRWDKPVGGGAQDRLMLFDVGILVRQLNGAAGISAYLESARDLLQGWTLPQGGAPLYVVDDKFVAHDNGIWRYNLTVATKFPCVPLEVADEDLPPFVYARLESSLGELSEVGTPPP